MDTMEVHVYVLQCMCAHIPHGHKRNTCTNNETRTRANAKAKAKEEEKATRKASGEIVVANVVASSPSAAFATVVVRDATAAATAGLYCCCYFRYCNCLPLLLPRPRQGMSHLGRNAAADGGSWRQRRRGGQPSLCRIMSMMSTMSITRASCFSMMCFLSCP